MKRLIKHIKIKNSYPSKYYLRKMKIKLKLIERHLNYVALTIKYKIYKDSFKSIEKAQTIY